MKKQKVPPKHIPIEKTLFAEWKEKLDCDIGTLKSESNIFDDIDALEHVKDTLKELVSPSTCHNQ